VGRPARPRDHRRAAEKLRDGGARGQALRARDRLPLPRRQPGIIEGLLSRGDRRVGAVIEQVWRDGGRFDGWSEHFSYDRWVAAARRRWPAPASTSTGTPPASASYDEVLPWDHLDSGLDKDWLWADWEDALDAPTADVEVEDCRWTPCSRLRSACARRWAPRSRGRPHRTEAVAAQRSTDTGMIRLVPHVLDLGSGSLGQFTGRSGRPRGEFADVPVPARPPSTGVVGGAGAASSRPSPRIVRSVVGEKQADGAREQGARVGAPRRGLQRSRVCRGGGLPDRLSASGWGAAGTPHEVVLPRPPGSAKGRRPHASTRPCTAWGFDGRVSSTCTAAACPALTAAVWERFGGQHRHSLRRPPRSRGAGGPRRGVRAGPPDSHRRLEENRRLPTRLHQRHDALPSRWSERLHRHRPEGRPRRRPMGAQLTRSARIGERTPRRSTYQTADRRRVRSPRPAGPDPDVGKVDIEGHEPQSTPARGACFEAPPGRLLMMEVKPDAWSGGGAQVRAWQDTRRTGSSRCTGTGLWFRTRRPPREVTSLDVREPSTTTRAFSACCSRSARTR
jgi:hypothetical protein